MEVIMINTIDRFSKWFLVQGLLVLILGIAIAVLPQIMTFTTALFLSIVLIIFGMYKLINAVVMRREIKNAPLEMLIGAVAAAAGVYLFVNPAFSLVILTMIIGFYFILEGSNSIAFAIQNKNYLRYWWMGIITGLIQYALAFVILLGLPSTALYTIGLLVGISLIFSGISLLTVYFESSTLRSAR